jgi:hypothetical protein
MMTSLSGFEHFLPNSFPFIIHSVIQHGSLATAGALK